MDWNIKSRNMKLHDSQRDTIQEKLSRLQRYLNGITDVKVECRYETLRGRGDTYTVQVTLMADHGIYLRAEEHHKDLIAAVDDVYDNLQRQVRRYKEKHYRRGKLRRAGGQIIAPPLPELELSEFDDSNAADNEELQIVRTKELVLRPMFSDEAIEQMELLGHTFFVYRDAETDKIGVVYRRHDGNYGLLLPR